MYECVNKMLVFGTRDCGPLTVSYWQLTFVSFNHKHDVSLTLTMQPIGSLTRQVVCMILCDLANLEGNYRQCTELFYLEDLLGLKYEASTLCLCLSPTKFCA